MCSAKSRSRLRPADAQRMVKTASQAGRQLMIGQVLPFFPEYAFAHQAVASGRYGRLLGGHFKRVISDPLWLKDFYDPEKVGGPMLDLHVHDAHFIHLLCGMPRAVSTIGRMRGAVAEYFTSQFLFDDRQLVVSAMSGVVQQQGRSVLGRLRDPSRTSPRCCTIFPGHRRQAGNEYAADRADRRRQGQCALKMKSSDPVDAFADELTEATKTVRNGHPSALLDGQLARDAIILCQMQTDSIAKGRVVKA